MSSKMNSPHLYLRNCRVRVRKAIQGTVQGGLLFRSIGGIGLSEFARRKRVASQRVSCVMEMRQSVRCLSNATFWRGCGVEAPTDELSELSGEEVVFLIEEVQGASYDDFERNGRPRVE